MTTHQAPAPVVALAFRTWRGPEDTPAIAEVLRLANLHDRTELIPTEAQIANELAIEDQLEPRQDCFLAELDGRVVATGDVRYVLRDDRPTFMLSGAVHPEARRRGIGRALLARLEARAAERAADLPTGDTVVLDAWMPDQNESFGHLIRGAGYEPTRYFFEMIKGRLETVEEGPLPDGLEYRPATMADLRRIFDAEAEAFQDHWGRREWTDADFAHLAADPELDLSLWRVAWDGDEVAGVVATWIVAEENAALGVRRGWLGQVSVRRPWRRRGVATALMLSACVGLRERGMDEAALGVDSANLTGALGLYERLGFAVHARATAWRKPLPPGPASQ